jgi:hypothetical protein
MPRTAHARSVSLRRGDRSRSTFESTLAKGPSVNEMGEDVTNMVTGVKGMSLKKRQHLNRAVVQPVMVRQRVRPAAGPMTGSGGPSSTRHPIGDYWIIRIRG